MKRSKKTAKDSVSKEPDDTIMRDLYFFEYFKNMKVYFTINRLKILTILCILSVGFLTIFLIAKPDDSYKGQVLKVEEKTQDYWFLLHRKSNVEKLFKGVPGSASESALIRTFQVKTGISGQRPTPLPQLLGREYWIITKKYKMPDDAETAPYFIELDVPQPLEEPYGPVPYKECNGQCNWQVPGPFGLHGVNKDNTRLSVANEGSSGCIRHTDSDITFLYDLIKVEDNIRYYIEDN